MKLDIKPTPISEKKEFKFQGDKLIQWKSVSDGTTTVYIYQRLNHYLNFRLMGYEVVIPKMIKGVPCYPSSEDFGTSGWFFPKSIGEDGVFEKAKEIMEKRTAKVIKNATIRISD